MTAYSLDMHYNFISQISPTGHHPSQAGYSPVVKPPPSDKPLMARSGHISTAVGKSASAEEQTLIPPFGLTVLGVMRFLKLFV